MRGALIADSGGLLRALGKGPSGKAAYPDYEGALLSANRVIVPGLVLGEVDYFLRYDRSLMRRLAAEIFAARTTYEYEAPTPEDIGRALEFDAKFHELDLGLVDGTVAAVAERLQVYRILTIDRRDFTALRVGPRYTRALELVP